MMLATQRPDAKSIPTGIRANAVLRMCLKVMGQIENDMVLGTSAYKQRHPGHHVRLRGQGRSSTSPARAARPASCRGQKLDGPGGQGDRRPRPDHARAAGRLTGYALGEDLDPARAARSPPTS